MVKFFLTNLHDNLREKVLKAKKDTFFNNLKIAMELKAIQQDICWAQNIAVVKGEVQLEEAGNINREYLTQEEIEQV
jgi:hypothetical protein